MGTSAAVFSTGRAGARVRRPVEGALASPAVAALERGADAEDRDEGLCDWTRASSASSAASVCDCEPNGSSAPPAGTGRLRRSRARLRGFLSATAPALSAVAVALAAGELAASSSPPAVLASGGAAWAFDLARGRALGLAFCLAVGRDSDWVLETEAGSCFNCELEFEHSE